MGKEESTNMPKTEKLTFDFENEYLKIGACEMQGWRKTMEDAAIILPNYDKKNTSLFGILDGHGGGCVSKFVAYNLKPLLIRTDSYKNGNFEQALVESFILMDDILQDPIINDFILKSQNQKDMQIPLDNPEEKNLVKFHYETNWIQYSLTKVFNNLSKDNNNLNKDIYTSIYYDNKNNEINLDGLKTNYATPNDDELIQGETNIKIDKKITEGIEVHENFIEEKFLVDFKNDFPLETKEENNNNSSNKLMSDLTGTTANIMLIKDNILYLANVGDSLSIMLNKKGKAIKLNREHKATLDSEKIRIENSGSKVINNRVNGVINLARALGDLRFKNNKEKGRSEQSIIAFPEITKITNLDDIDFIIMGCDGIWDCHYDKEKINKFFQDIKEIMDNNPEVKLSDILQQKFDEAISDVNGKDNMSCIILKFKH